MNCEKIDTSKENMKNISFSMTLKQFRAKTKFVTRRTGWLNLGRHTILQGVEKAQGLKKGERIKPLDKIVTFFVRREPLNKITPEDVVLEGFPEMSVEEFIDFFCRTHKCKPDEIVTRIEYGYLLNDSGDCYVMYDVKGKKIFAETVNFKKMLKGQL